MTLPAKRGTGSSPLARGLLEAHIGEPQGQRIIPARAGFTQPGGDGAEALEDHPRSRGVYVVSAPVTGGDGGSSPLARGLRP